MKKQRIKKYSLSNRRDTINVIDFFLHDKHKPKISAYKRKRLKELKYQLVGTKKKSEYQDTLRQVKKVFGINKNDKLSESLLYERKVRVKLRKGKDGWSISIPKASSTKRPLLSQRKSEILDLMYEYDEVLNKASEYNIDTYWSDFFSEFYNDWVNRFAKDIGMEHYSTMHIMDMVSRLHHEWYPLWATYGSGDCRRAITRMKKNNFQNPKNEIEKVVVRLYKKGA